MKQKKKMLTVLIVITFVLLILANLLHGLWRIIAWGAMIFSLAMFAVLWAQIWRCPHCGKHLGRMAESSDRCPHCGEKLE